MASKPTKYTYDTLIVERLLELQEEGLEAAESMRVALNDAICKHQLRADTTLCLLARLTANLIHAIQTQRPTPQSRDYVEEQFRLMLDCYLAQMDERDIANEMEKERKRRLN